MLRYDWIKLPVFGYCPQGQFCSPVCSSSKISTSWEHRFWNALKLNSKLVSICWRLVYNNIVQNWIIYLHRVFAFFCIYRHQFLFFAILVTIFMSCPIRSPRRFCEENLPFALTYRLYTISYIYIFFSFSLLWPGPLRTTPPNPPGTISKFPQGLIGRFVLGAPWYFKFPRVNFFKVRLFAVIFMRWDWKLDGYAILVCCIILTLHFRFLQHKRKHNSYLARNQGIQVYWVSQK